MSWQLFTAISVIGLSVSVILQRILMHKDKADPIAYGALFQGLVAAILLVFAVVHGFVLDGLRDLWLPALISMCLFGAGHIVYARTLQRVEASVFGVYFATHAVWVMIAGIIFLRESLTLLQILGSLFIFASVALVVNNYRHFSIDKGTLLGLFTGLLFGVAIACWAYVGRHMDGISWAACSFVGSALVTLSFSPRSAIKRMRPLVSKRVFPHMLLLSSFYALGSAAMLFAYNKGTLSLVSPLRQTGIILTVLLALLLLTQERNRIARKLLAALVCFTGVVLIVL
jgi:drug/metabolite transporter (DMT)-like permease